MKSGHLDAVLDHLPWIKTRTEPTNIEEVLPDTQLLKVNIEDDYYNEIIHFLVKGVAPEDFSTSQKKQLVVRASYF